MRTSQSIKRISLIIVISILVLFSGGTAVATLEEGAVWSRNVLSAPSQQQGPTDPAELEAFLDGFFAQKMEELHIPGVAFVMVKDGQVFFSKGYGYADLEKQIPVDPAQTIFRAGSVSKLFTATAATWIFINRMDSSMLLQTAVPM